MNNAGLLKQNIRASPCGEGPDVFNGLMQPDGGANRQGEGTSGNPV